MHNKRNNYRKFLPLIFIPNYNLLIPQHSTSLRKNSISSFEMEKHQDKKDLNMLFKILKKSKHSVTKFTRSYHKMNEVQELFNAIIIDKNINSNMRQIKIDETRKLLNTININKNNFNESQFLELTIPRGSQGISISSSSGHRGSISYILRLNL